MDSAVFCRPTGPSASLGRPCHAALRRRGVIMATVETVSTNAVVTGWPKRGTVLVMCFLATFVCFLDRVNMSVAAVAMQREFGWSESTKGMVLASFFVGYLVFQIPSGWLASRFGGRNVMAVAIIWWSLFTLLTPLAAMISLPMLILARI